MQYFLLFFLFGFNLKFKKEEISSNTSSLLSNVKNSTDISRVFDSHENKISFMLYYCCQTMINRKDDIIIPLFLSNFKYTNFDFDKLTFRQINTTIYVDACYLPSILNCPICESTSVVKNGYKTKNIKHCTNYTCFILLLVIFKVTNAISVILLSMLIVLMVKVNEDYQMAQLKELIPLLKKLE